MEAGGRIHLFDADGRQADLRRIRSQVSQISVEFFKAAMIDTRLLKNWIGDRVGKEPGSGVQLSGRIRMGFHPSVPESDPDPFIRMGQPESCTGAVP